MESGLFTATRSYDTAGRLTGVSNGSLDSTAYTLSADGRRTGIERNGQAESYDYDAARQVTSANYGGLATTQSWNYDAAGNRSSATTNGATTTYLANTVNEYTAITGSPAPPMYDPNGNAISYPVRPEGSASMLNGIFTRDRSITHKSQPPSAVTAPLRWPGKSDHSMAKLSYGGGVRRIDRRSWILDQGWSGERLEFGLPERKAQHATERSGVECGA